MYIYIHIVLLVRYIYIHAYIVVYFTHSAPQMFINTHVHTQMTLVTVLKPYHRHMLQTATTAQHALYVKAQNIHIIQAAANNTA
jgi:hypothetical protein